MNVRERIIEDAGKLFFREGIKRVTMDDVARELGISKRTIYENFKDKNELLTATLQQITNLQNLSFEKIKESSQNVLEIMVGILRFGHESIARVNEAYISDLERYYPRIWRTVFNNSTRERLSSIEDLLEQGKTEGFFRPEINSRMVARVFNEELLMLHNSRLFPPGEFPRKELFETVFLNFIRGISTRKGADYLESMLNTS